MKILLASLLTLSFNAHAQGLPDANLTGADARNLYQALAGVRETDSPWSEGTVKIVDELICQRFFRGLRYAKHTECEMKDRFAAEIVSLIDIRAEGGFGNWLQRDGATDLYIALISVPARSQGGNPPLMQKAASVICEQDGENHRCRVVAL